MNELDDFLDVREVKGWQPTTWKKDLLAFVLMVAFASLIGLTLWLV
jgi:hypothetical protein